jgi:hypothetical protein
MREDLIDPKLDRPTIRNLFRLLTDTRTLTGGVVIGKENAPILNFDANGAGRNVDFPAPDAELEGAIFLVNNFSGTAVDLTCRNSATATILTVSQAEAGVVFYAGGVTYGRLLGTIT